MELYTREEVELCAEVKPKGGKFKDIEGQTFGYLEVIKYAGKKVNSSTWYCQCSCGNIVIKHVSCLISGRAKLCAECSCLLKKLNYKNNLIKEVILKFPSIKFLYSPKEDYKSLWDWHCTSCSTNFKATVTYLKKVTHATPCLCDNGVNFLQWTQELRESQVKNVCLKVGAIFLGWTSAEGYQDAHSRVLLKCSKDHSCPEWECSITNFVNSSHHGCPTCAKDIQYKNIMHTLEDLKYKSKLIYGDLYSYDSFIYKGVVIKGEIFCKKCGKYFWRTWDSHINSKNGCPCGKIKSGYRRDVSGWFYVQHLDHSVIKFGISNKTPEDRMAQQSKVSIFNHTLIYKFYFEDGNTPFLIEKLCKEKLPTGVVPKDEMNDGFTETCFIGELDNLLNLVGDYLKAESNFRLLPKD